MDPLVSLMMVEKVPDSTYEMVGGLDKQIKEIKEVCETCLHVFKHKSCIGRYINKGQRTKYQFCYLKVLFISKSSQVRGIHEWKKRLCHECRKSAFLHNPVT